jgi:hypothetical protein
LRRLWESMSRHIKLRFIPLAGPFPKLNDKSPLDVGPAEPGAVNNKKLPSFSCR